MIFRVVRRNLPSQKIGPAACAPAGLETQGLHHPGTRHRQGPGDFRLAPTHFFLSALCGLPVSASIRNLIALTKRARRARGKQGPGIASCIPSPIAPRELRLTRGALVGCCGGH